MRVGMKHTKLSVLKFFALLFLLPGLGGLVFSATVSTDYLENLPKSPAPSEQRMTPRNVHGTVIYQTVQEDHCLIKALLRPRQVQKISIGKFKALANNRYLDSFA